MIGTGLLLASLAITSPTTSVKAPYDVALEFCENKGGIAVYSPIEDTVEFSCGDSPSEIYVIKE